MAISKKLLSCLDGGQLAAFCQHLICFERSALYNYLISAVYSHGTSCSTKLVAQRVFRCLVNTLSIIIYHAIRQRLVGVLSVLNLVGNQ